MAGGVKKTFGQDYPKTEDACLLKKRVRSKKDAKFQLSCRQGKTVHISTIMQDMRTTGLLPEKKNRRTKR